MTECFILTLTTAFECSFYNHIVLYSTRTWLTGELCVGLGKWWWFPAQAGSSLQRHNTTTSKHSFIFSRGSPRLPFCLQDIWPSAPEDGAAADTRRRSIGGDGTGRQDGTAQKDSHNQNPSSRQNLPSGSEKWYVFTLRFSVNSKFIQFSGWGGGFCRRGCPIFGLKCAACFLSSF